MMIMMMMMMMRMLTADDVNTGARVQQSVLQFAVRHRDAAQDDRRKLLRLRQERLQPIRQLHRHPQVRI